MTRRTTNRRRLLAASALALPMASTSARAVSAVQDAPIVGVAQAPLWSFTVVSIDDPYLGEITRPREPDPDSRFVAAQVIVTNGSSAPLEFEVSDVRLVDAEGIEYPGGDAAGAEPKLVGQNLPDGERTRGWVWYQLPTDVAVAEIRFYGPRPIFRVAAAETSTLG